MLAWGKATGAAACIASLILLVPLRAWATDEIQVYNAAIAEVGQWTIEQHLNYTLLGQKQPPFAGGLVSNHTLNGTPELGYGITDWWELGFYAPFAVNSDGQFLSDGAKIRTLFVSPNADKRNFFYGINFEFSYETSPFSQTHYGLEIRPIIGVRNTQWEFIVNPIVDLGFGALGEQDFAPALRLARNLGDGRFVGFEYYADLGQIGNFLPFAEQSHQLFAVADFKVDKFDLELGVGYGLTPGSDRWVTKAIIGYAFPVPGMANNEFTAPMTPMFTKATARSAIPGLDLAPIIPRQ